MAEKPLEVGRGQTLARFVRVQLRISPKVRNELAR
jgi:hypothetical protein